jgi:hypothetical protein
MEEENPKLYTSEKLRESRTYSASKTDKPIDMDKANKEATKNQNKQTP